jgi:UDP-glucose 4-epimerase
MKVLLTGGLGYIGSHTAIELLKSGHTPFIIDNLVNTEECVHKELAQITGNNIVFEPIDCKDVDKLCKFIFRNDIDSIIHLAGLKSVAESIANPAKYLFENITGTLSIIKTIDNTRIKNFVFSSSCTVYGESKVGPLTEESTISPINPYGFSKWKSEQIISYYTKSNSSLSSTILRYFNPAGNHQSGRIGDNPTGRHLNIFPLLCQAAHDPMVFINVFGDDYETKDGTAIRDYVHVQDVARAHVLALERLDGKPRTMLINLGSGRGYSVMELIKMFEKITKNKINYTICPRRLGDASIAYADFLKAKQELGWTITYELEDMCRSALINYKFIKNRIKL